MVLIRIIHSCKNFCGKMVVAGVHRTFIMDPLHQLHNLLHPNGQRVDVVILQKEIMIVMIIVIIQWEGLDKETCLRTRVWR